MSEHTRNSHSDVAELRSDHRSTLPPPYSSSETSKFHDIPLEKTDPMASGPRLEPEVETSRDNFNFGFFKPKEQTKWLRIVSWLATIIMIAIIATSSAFAIKDAVSGYPDKSGNGTSEDTTGHTEPPSSTPFLERRSVQGCWENLLSICANDSQVPTDRVSNGFGECADTYQYFYCGLIMRHPSTGNTNAAAAGKDSIHLVSVKPSILGRASNRAGARAVVDFSACYNMLDFCIESQMQQAQPASQAQATRANLAKSKLKPVATIKQKAAMTTFDATVTPGLPRAAALTERAVPTAAALPNEDNLMKTWIK